ncbi:MAG: hypothetical protein LBI01_03030 [Elusimicrobium sp.]|jgi:hypothetical protein|nr:hypothetical protein [Elusimicrobium sp.]
MKRTSIVLFIIIGLLLYFSEDIYKSFLEKKSYIVFQQLNELAGIAEIYHKQNNKYPKDWTVLDIPYKNKKIESDGLWIGNNNFKILPDGSITGKYFITEVFFTYTPAQSDEQKSVFTCAASGWFNSKQICQSFTEPANTIRLESGSNKGKWYIYPIKE